MSDAAKRANAEQLAAADPAVSAFVAASAGTGKTKLLTDRLLRLLLAGTAPEKILCLTYTKAAAAEMAIRLHRRLGKWVMMGAAGLAAELAALDMPTAPEMIARARRLFAEVLDVPGGMRISTIHAFCQSLLRRFPLEAGLSPHFELADDWQAASQLREVRETVLALTMARDAISRLAAETDEQAFAGLTAQFCDFRNELAPLLEAHGATGLAGLQAAALGVGNAKLAHAQGTAAAWPSQTSLRDALRLVAAQGTPTGTRWAGDCLDWLGQPEAARDADWTQWISLFLTKDEKPRALSNYCGKALLAANPALGGLLADEQDRILDIEDARRAETLAALNQALGELVLPVMDLEAGQRQNAARLGYGDLIAHADRLLTDPGAAWVLFKLDGGIDHLLLDEVQDTAPAQWRLAERIAEEFFAGAGAREVRRSIFAVGDAKQSIFSFQGADLYSFEHYRQIFRARVTGAGRTWLDGALSVSFRSTAPVLALVDAVFADGPVRDGVCAPGAVLEHRVSRLGQAGAVSLWPLVVAPAKPELPDWAVPDEYQPSETPRLQLAREIVEHIEVTLRAKTLLPSRNRTVTPGDILILVRSRNDLADSIISLCKARNIPIAGQDRLVLTGNQAVSDLLALCDSLLLPDDDLAFGQYLASPLGGLSDESLMALAMGRRGTLAAALFARRAERKEWAAAQGFFDTLRARVDFLTPHALLAEALGPLGGRARLMRRLGPEAAEPMDELLAEALNHASLHPPSLQAFVHELRLSGASIKREADAAGERIRIMTVHGAKGLQAPIVILPDTTGLPPDQDRLIWLTPPGRPGVTVPIFCPRKALRTRAVTAAALANKEMRRAEHHRLLYVALTRAEDELIICGAETGKKSAEETWYAAVAAGFSRLAGVVVDADGRRHVTVAQALAPDRQAVQETMPGVALPGWAGAAPDWLARPPAMEASRPEPLAPSRGADEESKQAMAASPVGDGLAEAREARAQALARGRATHALLQHLPDLPAAARARAAAKFLARQAELDEPARAEIAVSVLNILRLPALAPLFGPASRAEVPLAGVVGAVEFGGLVDRLAVLPDKILLADYKTDRVPPATTQEIAAIYLRQLAAYRAILAQIYPDRPLTCLLIFTRNAVVMPVPPELLASHAPAGAPA